MKRILHVAEPFATGVLSFLLDITRKQVENYEVYILYGVRPLTPKNVDRLFDRRVKLIKSRCFRGALGTVLNPKAYREVYDVYERIRPDIIHLHSSASGFVGRWVLPCGKARVFYTPHGYSFLMRDGSIIKRSLFWLMEWLSARRTAMTVACGKGEYEEALRLSKKCAYVNNGIRVEELTPYLPTSEELHSPLSVCASGRILEQKNPRLFNEIASLLPDVEFTWIGEGELAKELTSPNIRVTGWLSREKALDVLRQADLFLLPSLWEGLPISLLEAMYLKKACLVSDAVGNRDVIRTGVNGFVCEAAADYAKVIKAITEGEINVEAIRRNAHEDVKRNYNAELMAEKYDKIYNQ